MKLKRNIRGQGAAANWDSMISIETKYGVSLDLAPDFEFQMEIEQPLLSDDRMPVPFTTDIAFPPTETNKREFGYIPAMMLEPKFRDLEVTIFVSGFPIMRGHLVYAGIEDGNLQYTFTGSEKMDSWNENIDFDLSEVYTDATVGHGTDFACPVIINESAVAKVLLDTDQTSEHITYDNKYRNYNALRINLASGLAAPRPIASPVMRIRYLLQQMGLSIESFPEDGPLRTNLNIMGILCQYKAQAISSSLGATVNLSGENAPKITYSDVLRELLKMHCCALYSERGKLAIHSANELFDASPAINLDGRISDIFTSTPEPATRYSFSFENSDENKFDSKSASGSDQEDEIIRVNTLDDLKTAIESADPGEYKSYKVDEMGDTFSVRRHTRSGTHTFYNNIRELIDADNIYHDMGGTSDNGITADDSLELKSGWELVRCTIDCLFANSQNPLVKRYVMAPVIPAQSVEDERGDKVYVGLIRANNAENQQFCQFVDKGFFFNNDSGEGLTGNITPGFLYRNLHKKFAEWLGRSGAETRQYVRAELDLTAPEIFSISLSRPVYFLGRKWMIKKIALTFRAGSNRIETVGEFISMSDNTFD